MASPHIQIGTRVFAAAALCLGCWGFVSVAHAHELQENRAHLTLRDERHVSTSFYIQLSRVFNAGLSQPKARFEHLAQLAAMPEKAFVQQYQSLQTPMQSSVIFRSRSGEAIPVQAWQWPDAKAAQNHMRRLVMQALTDPDAHPDEEPFEIRLKFKVDAKSGPLESLEIELPQVLRPMTIVTTRPRQQRISAGQSKTTIQF